MISDCRGFFSLFLAIKNRQKQLGMRKLFYDILLAAEKEQGFVLPPAITRQILAMKRKRQKMEQYSGDTFRKAVLARFSLLSQTYDFMNEV